MTAAPVARLPHMVRARAVRRLASINELRPYGQKRGEPAASITGLPGEVLRYLFGRKGGAQVEVSGPAPSVDAVRQARFGT